MAVYCCVVPTAIEELAGVTEIETSEAATVSNVDPLMVPAVALIVVVPAARAVATPCVPTVLLMLATVALEELHVTDLVMS